MPEKYENAKGYKDCWYALTANRLLVTLGGLNEQVNCDVCVIGGGFTGLSAALELAEKGLSVTLLEKETIAGSASGRNGGQVLRGYSKQPGALIGSYGLDTARQMSNISLEGLALILGRIKAHAIPCDLKFGHLTAAMNGGHVKELKKDIDDLHRLGQNDVTWLDRDAARALVHTEAYVGGLFDQKGAHFHPLNYALGIAQAAQASGAMIYEHTAAVDIVPGSPCKVITAEGGTVIAKHVIIAGALDIKGLGPVRRTSLTATAHIVSTLPLGMDAARQVMSRDIAVADARYIMDYYRFTNDYRLLFGGNCNYSNREYPGEGTRLKKRIKKIFPQLENIEIEHCWHGPLDLTANAMPHVGRLAPQIYFAHGFGGHGLIATNMMGKILADAVAGQTERFDVFDKIRHNPLPGGDLLRRPLFMLGMLWYRLRDILG
jgi:gamma-glutamylputrescine oxidase